jgi:hypothetical protein
MFKDQHRKTGKRLSRCVQRTENRGQRIENRGQRLKKERVEGSVIP